MTHPHRDYRPLDRDLPSHNDAKEVQHRNEREDNDRSGGEWFHGGLFVSLHVRKINRARCVRFW